MKLDRCFLHFILSTLALCTSVSADEPAHKELPDKIQTAVGAMEPLGYRVESTNFENEPDRQIVVTMSAAGEILDIRARLSGEKNVAEWALFYQEGVPVLAQLKKWKMITLEGEEIGEALTLVETFFPIKGMSEISDESSKKQLEELIAFAEKARVEP